MKRSAIPSSFGVDQMTDPARPVLEDDFISEVGLEQAAKYFVFRVKERSELTFSARKQLINNLWKHYLNKPRERSGAQSLYKSNIPVPVSTEAVDTGLAFILPKMFQSYRMVNIVPNSEEDRLLSPVMEDKLEYDNRVMGSDNEDKNGAYLAYFGLVLNTLIGGLGIARVKPERKRRKFSIRGASNLPEMGEVVYEGTGIENIDVMDVFPDPAKKYIGDRHPIIVRSFHSWEELKSQQADMEYFDLENIPQKRRAFPTDLDELRSEREDMLKIESVDRGMPDSIEVWECECWFPISGKKDEYGNYVYQPCVITLANKHLIGMRVKEPDDDSYLVASKICHVPGMLFGIGVLEKIHPQQHLGNALLDSILDNIPYLTNRQKLVVRKNLENPSQLRSVPGSPIYVKPGKDVRNVFKEIEVPPLPNDVYRMLDWTIRRAEMTSGFTEMAKGGGGTGVETATEASELGFWSTARGTLYLNVFEQTAIVPIHRKQAKLNAATVSADFIAKLWPKRREAWREIQRRSGFAIEPSFISVAFSREADERVAIQQISNVIEIAKGHPILYALLPFAIMHLVEKFNWQDMKDDIFESLSWSVKRYYAMEKKKMLEEKGQEDVNAGGLESVEQGQTAQPPAPGEEPESSRPQNQPQAGNAERFARSEAQSMSKALRGKK